MTQLSDDILAELPPQQGTKQLHTPALCSGIAAQNSINECNEEPQAKSESATGHKVEKSRLDV